MEKVGEENMIWYYIFMTEGWKILVSLELLLFFRTLVTLEAFTLVGHMNHWQ